MATVLVLDTDQAYLDEGLARLSEQTRAPFDITLEPEMDPDERFPLISYGHYITPTNRGRALAKKAGEYDAVIIGAHFGAGFELARIIHQIAENGGTDMRPRTLVVFHPKGELNSFGHSLDDRHNYGDYRMDHTCVEGEAASALVEMLRP